ncbi:hypothetical protein [Mesobacillus sp.]
MKSLFDFIGRTERLEGLGAKARQIPPLYKKAEASALLPFN